MASRTPKYAFGASLVLAAAALVLTAPAQISETYNSLPRHFPTKERFAREFAGSHKNGGAHNLIYHGGPVIHSARVVSIFWGPSWGTGGPDSATATSAISFINNFGTSSHYIVIT